MMLVRNVAALLRRAPDGSERRQAGRFYVLDLPCGRGKVLDLSGTGVRLLTRRAWSVGSSRRVRFGRGERRVELLCSCAWRERIGTFTWIVGLTFQDVDEAGRSTLVALVRRHAEEQDPDQRLAA